LLDDKNIVKQNSTQTLKKRLTKITKKFSLEAGNVAARKGNGHDHSGTFDAISAQCLP